MHRHEITGRIERYDQRVKIALLLVSLGTLVLLAIAAYRENFQAQWRLYQLEYSGILASKAKDSRQEELARGYRVELRQLVLPELGAVDRCVSCHTGIDDPRMTDQQNPFKTHPGDYLAAHEPARFGCTSCHQGQGRATEVEAAHGRLEHWPEPLVERKFLGSTCGRCHLDADLFGGEGDFYSASGQPIEISHAELTREVPGGELITRGKRLFRETGCLGCHSYRGKGGSVGPDLTYVGDKTRHDFDFSSFGSDEPRTVEYWLEKHFLKPQEISPETIMPPLDVGPEDVVALTAYMLSLKRKTVPASHQPAPRALAARPADGGELYRLLCAACHGQDGRESEVPGLRTPALNNLDFLAVAGDDYLRSIIANGRSNTAMPSWSAGGGNLTRNEIDRLVGHIRGWEPPGPDLRGISSRRGSSARGRALYAGNCGNCHGVRGEGGIGNALNSATFLAAASDGYLARTIVGGRPGTAMPSWKHFSEQDVSDVLAHMRSWYPRELDRDRIVGLSSSLPDAEAVGRLAYRAHCASCHGVRGEGGIGVTLNSDDFLARVQREYLYDAIARGRPDTAMPSWSHLTAEQIAGLIAYIKSWQQRSDVPEGEPLPRGDRRLGEVAYQQACSACHGARGEGGSGPQIAGPAFLESASDSLLYAWIGYGKVGTAMKGFLPEAKGIARLTRSQILDVIAYLRYVAASGEPLPARMGAGDARKGAELYVGSCAPCHGRHGEGASGPQLNNPAFLRSASDGFLTATIVLGRTGTAMRSMVHGQEGLGQIAPDDVDDVVAFLRGWSYPETWRVPRPAAEMTEEATGAGRVAYGRYCAGCHGPRGQGVADGPDYFAPALNNPEFLHAASDGFLLATIARGRQSTPMRPFGRGAGGIVELPDHEINDIVSFIRSWDLRETLEGTAVAGLVANPPSSEDGTGGTSQGVNP